MTHRPSLSQNARAPVLPHRLGGLAFLAILLLARSMAAQSTRPDSLQRPAIPMSAAILRAHAAGTRDSTGRPGRRYWQNRTSYAIDARLDPATSVVSAHASIVLHNASPQPIDVVHLRLDQNRFRRPDGAGSDVPRPTSGMVVTSLVVDGEAAVIGPGYASARPALSGTHETAERIMLARPAASGDSIVLAVSWHFEVPLDDASSSLRLGRWGNDVYQVAQWYPRVAMFDDLNGWDTTSYTGDVEFYNLYGRFDVRLDVPAGWLIGATGVLRNPDAVLASRTHARLADVSGTDTVVTIVGADERGPGTATHAGERLVWHFVADTVSDFAWGASPSYIWQAARVEIPRGPPVLAHMLFTPAGAARFEAAWPQLRHDLAFNSSLIMPYGFPQHTLLEGPEGGMEYPMLTMSDGSRLSHELWHQWFPIMVGSNETWYSFMDEGLASFLARVTTAAGSRTPAGMPSRTSRPLAPLVWPDDRGPPHPVTAVYGYGKTAEMLTELGEMVGHQRVLDALGEYARAWRFRHPSPWDFMFMMSRGLDRDLDAFWYRWIFSAG